MHKSKQTHKKSTSALKPTNNLITGTPKTNPQVSKKVNRPGIQEKKTQP